MDFEGFPKIPRYSRECIITEKIDGTNAQIFITEDGGGWLTGSRNKWIRAKDDHYGFAKWADLRAIEEDLLALGPGRHFGEWWGQGIQRNYGLKEKRFSLFNVIRWNEEMFEMFKVKPWVDRERQKDPGERPVFVPPPSCCHVVPVIMTCPMPSIGYVEDALCVLNMGGSLAAPGFKNPEGIVIYHTAGNVSFKKTIGSDGAKGEQV